MEQPGLCEGMNGDRRTQETSPVRSLYLQRLIPSGYQLEINVEQRILNLVRVGKKMDSDPREYVLSQPQFSRNEWDILLALFDAYPFYAPHELLLSRVTALSPDQCRVRFSQAASLGAQAVKRELKPVYRALSGIRAKLRLLTSYVQIEIVLVPHCGYLLSSPCVCAEATASVHEHISLL